MTDVDFLAYDEESNEAALFQLKWQQMAGVDTRARRSAARNLVSGANQWITAVNGWLERNGASELGRRASLGVKSDVKFAFFVLARYEASFPAIAQKDETAAWTDCAHFLKVMLDHGRKSPRQLAQLLKAEATKIEYASRPESLFLPLGNLTIAVNPTSEPPYEELKSDV